MKKITVFVTLLMAIALTACSKTKTKEPEPEIYVEDQIYYDDEYDVNFVIFGSGYSIFIKRIGGTEWEMLVSYDTGDIYLNEFEFEEATADLTLLTGGEAGYYKSPRIKNVSEHHSISFAEVVERGLIEDYEPGREYFDGARLYEADGQTFCIVQSRYNEFNVYKDCELIGTYQTAAEVETALGIAGQSEE